jgi:hypothetical protein
MTMAKFRAELSKDPEVEEAEIVEEETELEEKE